MAATPAFASETAASGDDAGSDPTSGKSDIVVKGSVDKGDAQRPPTSGYHVDGKFLEDQRIDSLSDLQQVAPSLNVDEGDPFNTTLSIRGNGDGGGQTGGEVNIGMPSSVGLFLDGVYLARPGMLSSGFNDVESIDVYNGATQGTLYSANVTGGVIDIHTREPGPDLKASSSFSYGSYGYLRASAAVSGKITDNLYAGISYMHTGLTGNVRNVANGDWVNGSSGNGVRAQLVWHPSDTVKAKLIADYSHEHSTSTPVLYKTLTIGGVDLYDLHSSQTGNINVYGRKVDLDDQNYFTVQSYGISPQIFIDLAGGWKFSSISSIRFLSNDPSASDGQSIDVYHDSGWRVRDKTFYQEFRLDTPHWKWGDLAMGVSYSGERTNSMAHSRYGADAAAWYGSSSYTGLDVLRYGKLHDDFYGVFAQGTFHILPKLDLKAGVRESIDYKRGSFVRLNKSPFDSGVISQTKGLPSAMLNLNYRPDANTLIYLAGAYAEKAGAMNISSGAAGKAGNDSLILKPETTQTIELGLQKDVPQIGLSAKVDLFESWVHDFQTQGYDVASQSTYLLNAGEYRGRGVEASATWASSFGLTLSPYFMLNDMKYLDYDDARCAPEVTLGASPPASCDLTGKPVFRAPRYTANVNARYETPVSKTTSLYYTARYSWRSSTYSTVDDSPSAKIPAYGLVNMSLGVTRQVDKHVIDASVWVNNLFDKSYYLSLREGDYGSVFGYIGSPRTIGGTIRISY
ncbi:TonB-dependent receptor [Novosphingobium sp. 9]|uniref:TonB-dependent receptor n=1 Tax=Novosphingobium sp. 9 TaxID=2025349 RepID=UPI0021B53B0B|nr:TonB-dependent receptor [Novosphingobium sp. 9]